MHYHHETTQNFYNFFSRQYLVYNILKIKRKLKIKEKEKSQRNNAKMENTANKQFFDQLNNKIAELIIKRRKATDSEQATINEKLTKLYNLKWQYLQQ